MPHPWKHPRSGWIGLWAAWSSSGCPCSLQAGCGLSACETICCYKDEKIYLRHTNLKHSSHFTEDKETVRIENVVRWWCKNMKKKHFAWIGWIKAFLLMKNICMKNFCVKLCSIWVRSFKVQLRPKCLCKGNKCTLSLQSIYAFNFTK